MTVPFLSLPTLALVAALAAVPAQQGAAPSQPAGETIDVNATVSAPGAATGTVVVPMVIRIDRYTNERQRGAMLDALKYRGGYPGFLQALREAPAAGYLETGGGQKFVIRWAHSEATAEGRTISIVTDTPVYFIGSGKRGAKPTAGYEVAVAKLTLDGKGHGEGVMAAAARVKPSGTSGVQIDDYAETPVKLTAVVRAPK